MWSSSLNRQKGRHILLGQCDTTQQQTERKTKMAKKKSKKSTLSANMKEKLFDRWAKNPIKGMTFKEYCECFEA